MLNCVDNSQEITSKIYNIWSFRRFLFSRGNQNQYSFFDFRMIHTPNPYALLEMFCCCL